MLCSYEMYLTVESFFSLGVSFVASLVFHFHAFFFLFFLSLFFCEIFKYY